MNKCNHRPKSSELGLALNPITSQLFRVDVFCEDCQEKVYSLSPREVMFEKKHWRLCENMFRLIRDFKEG